MAQVVKSERFEARFSPEALELVKRAAEIEGRSVSDFLASAALEAARKTIEQSHLVRLSLEDSYRFVEIILNPPTLSPAMERAKEAHTRLIRESK